MINKKVFTFAICDNKVSKTSKSNHKHIILSVFFKTFIVDYFYEYNVVHNYNFLASICSMFLKSKCWKVNKCLLWSCKLTKASISNFVLYKYNLLKQVACVFETWKIKHLLQSRILHFTRFERYIESKCPTIVFRQTVYLL